MVSEQTVMVLFIGGDVTHRRLVFEALQGAQPVQLLGECGSIDGALPLLEELSPNVIIMDLTLPSIRDLGGAQQVRQRSPGCKLITLIHEEDELGMYLSIDAGAVACYPMGHPPEFLASIVRQVARGEEPIHYTVLVHIAAGAAFMDIIVGCLCEPQSGIKLAACQESGVRGDGSATKIQADSAVELELQRGVGAFTHWVPPARLRYPELDPLARPV